MIDYTLEKAEEPKKGFSNLYDIVNCLRDPEQGCPWDREQMPADIIRSMQGEIYEYIDALNEGDDAHVSEELGDIFLNLFLLAKIHDQNGDFSLASCLNDACEKYIRRHPHVFSNVSVSSSADVLSNWQKIKTNVEGRKSTGFFDNVPKSTPELEKSYKISKLAAKVGFDWPSVEGIYDKVEEELGEVKEASNSDAVCEEIGDLLFTVVQLARVNHIKPQDALAKANLKFVSRFNKVVELAKEQGLEVEALSAEQLDELWKKIKFHD